MPQPVLHLVLADASLRRWLAQPARAPFDVEDPSSRAAFLLGCLAPDMGFFPGGSDVRDFSAAAHAGGSTTFARVLLRTNSNLLTAFTWGWMSHVLADVRIHPLVNLGGAALLHDEGIREPDEGLRLVAHIRVELGIEGCYSRRPVTPPAVLKEVFTDTDLRPVAEAARAAFRLQPTPTSLLAAQRAITSCIPFCEQLADLLAADLLRGNPRCSTDDFLRLPGVRRVASRLCSPASPVLGFLNPVRPPDWLMKRVDSEVSGFPEFFDELAAGGLEGVPDFNLNTGEHAGLSGVDPGVIVEAA